MKDKGSLIKLPECVECDESDNSFYSEEAKTILKPRMQFKNHKNKLVRPYIAYCDMEATLSKIDEDDEEKNSKQSI